MLELKGVGLRLFGVGGSGFWVNDGAGSRVSGELWCRVEGHRCIMV